jgi:hypothetical protein
MASYEKLTLERFKAALKEGKYTGLTGARRAIGKTTSWNAKERAAAQELANKHFGESGETAKSAPKKTAPKKASAKTTAKKASAKGTHGSKSVGKKATSAKKAAVDSIEREPVSASSSEAIRASSGFEHRVAAHESLAFVSHARQELQQFKAMNSALNTSKEEKALFDILENAIAHMGKALPHADAQVSAVPRVEVPKTEATRIVKNVTDDAAAPAKAEAAEDIQTVEQVEQNGTIDDKDLTPAERSARDLLSGAPDLGLPRPSQI